MIQNRIITVFGAYGHTGRFVVSELRKRGFTAHSFGSRRRKAERGGGTLTRDRKCAWLRWMIPPRLTVHFPAQWPSSIVRGRSSIRRHRSLTAALRASIHYLDVAAEQAAVLAVFERFANAARDAGSLVAPPWRSLGDWATSCPLPLWGSGCGGRNLHRSRLDSWEADARNSADGPAESWPTFSSFPIVD